MSIQFSGLGSGLPVDEWITKLVEVKKASIEPLETKKTDLDNSSKALGIIKSSFEKFKTSLKTFTDVSSDLFSKKSATSSHTEFVTATAGAKAPMGKYSIFVEQLATNTVAKSEGSVGEALSLSTKFSDIKGAQTGNISFTLNGTTKSITLDDNTTMQDFITEFSTEFPDVTAMLNNGKLSFITSDVDSFSVGMADDTSNFKNILKLSDVENPAVGTKQIESTSAISITNTDGKMTTGEANLNGAITAGTFKINGQTFEITEDTTVNQIINQINNNKSAGVNAAFDANTNQLTLTSTSTGSIGINMEDTDNTGFFETFRLNSTPASTTLGKDALLTINGSRISSTSNTVSNTGYDGLTVNLLKVPASTQEITLNIQGDLTDLKKETQTFIDSYNTIVNQIKEATQEDGYLEMDSGLRSIYNQFRQITSSMTNPTDSVNLMAQIGISSGAVGMSVDEDTTTLKFDADKFATMCNENMDAVKKLLTDSNTGVMSQLLTKTEFSLASETGYFAARGDTFTKQIKLQDERITKAYEDLDTYQTRLEKQFQAMDSMIAKLNEQYQGFVSTTGSSSS